MSINFDNKDDRMGYLNEKMDDLLDGINEQYGKALFDELIIFLKYQKSVGIKPNNIILIDRQT